MSTFTSERSVRSPLLTALRNPVTIAWAVLMAATLLSWWMGADHGSDAGELVTVSVLIVAFVKVQVVGLYFMELRHAPLPLRLVFDLWTVAVCGALVLMYLLG